VVAFVQQSNIVSAGAAVLVFKMNEHIFSIFLNIYYYFKFKF